MTQTTARRPVHAYAHRGGAEHPDLTGLENTLTAFLHARALGYRYMETDVHVTADGVLVAFHDDVLDRVTDRTGAIADLPAAEVCAARIGGAEPVPTFLQLVEALPDVVLNVDIKSPRAAAALASFVAEHRLEDRILVGSFSGRRLEEFRRLVRGTVATSAHSAEVAAYVLSPSARLARWLTRGRPVALQIPHRHRGIPVATRGVVRRAHRNGLEVHVWTIDDPAEMELLLDLGVDGIMTDRTDVLRDVLVRRGQWEELA